MPLYPTVVYLTVVYFKYTTVGIARCTHSVHTMYVQSDARGGILMSHLLSPTLA